MTSLVQAYSGKRVLVTGHTGFKGSWLAFWLTELGAEVTGYALAPEYENSHFELLGLEHRTRHVEADLRDADRLQQVFAEVKPEMVFHLAAQALVRRSYLNPKTTFDTNLGGSVNLLEAVRGSENVRALVYITSDKCYLNKEWIWGYRENDELGGHDPYSASKAAAEMAYMAYCHSYFDEAPPAVASARAGNVIGGGDWAEDRIVPDCVRALKEGREIIIRSPDATRPWQHVLDPLHGYLCLAGALAEGDVRSGESWNFGPDISHGKTVLEVAETAVEFWGQGQVVVNRPVDSPFEHRLLQLSNDKAKLELRWFPRWENTRAIRETLSWYKRDINGEPTEDVSREQIVRFSEQTT